ncbi:MAG: hypothetical protein IJS74_01615 [Clostridia bacterium]|nr:hypothetical protein [Clostridia bacterium]
MARFNYNDPVKLPDDPKKRSAVEHYLNGENLSFADKLALGDRETSIKYNGYQCKPDCAYRGVDKKAYDAYLNAGCVFDNGPDFEPGSNAGIDWFLGAVGERYANKGGYVIECPADKRYFDDSGYLTSKDPRARHLKSGNKNPVKLENCRIMTVENMKNGNYENIIENQYPYQDIPEDKPPIIDKPSKEQIDKAKDELGIKEPEILIEKRNTSFENEKNMDFEDGPVFGKNKF